MTRSAFLGTKPTGADNYRVARDSGRRSGALGRPHLSGLTVGPTCMAAHGGKQEH
jgi:hypothetical protein